MKKQTCPKCEGSGEIDYPSPRYKSGERVKAVQFPRSATGTVVGASLVPPVSVHGGGTFEDYVYIIQFDDGTIKPIGEAVLDKAP